MLLPEPLRPSRTTNSPRVNVAERSRKIGPGCAAFLIAFADMIKHNQRCGLVVRLQRVGVHVRRALVMQQIKQI